MDSAIFKLRLQVDGHDSENDHISIIPCFGILKF